MMNENLRKNMDDLEPAELDGTLRQIGNVSLPEGVSEDRIREKVRAMTGTEKAAQKVKLMRPAAWKRFAPIAASFLVLALGAAILIPKFIQDPGSLPVIEKTAAPTEDLLGCFTLEVDSGIRFEVAEDRTVKSVKKVDDSTADVADFTFLEGQDVSTSLQEVLGQYQSKGFFAKEEAVQISFDKGLTESSSEKNDIVQTLETFFVDTEEHPRIIVGQISDDSEEMITIGFVGLGNVKQIIGEELGWPNGLANTFAEVTEDENGVYYYHLLISSDQANYDCLINAITGEIIRRDQIELPEEPTVTYSDIDEETAKQIALTYIDAPLDTPCTVSLDQGEYTVSFQIDDIMFVYQIRFSDGTITGYEKTPLR